MYNLNLVLKSCENKLDNLNIPYGNVIEIVPNTRAKKRWGQCVRTNGVYKININAGLLNENEPLEALECTVLHELLHTVNGCFNHGDKWQNLANKVNRTYGYNIKRCSSAAEKGVSDSICGSREEYKIAVKCTSCNSVWKYKRNSKTVEACRYNRAKCSCGGKEFIVFNL